MSESTTPAAHDEPPTEAESPEKPDYLVHSVLLAFTLLTTMVVGARFQYHFAHGLPMDPDVPGALPMFPLHWIRIHPANLLLGAGFSLALMSILFAHEMGHYLACRRYRVDATPPYFLPAPTLIGTLGAFIQIRSPFPSRRSLFDIGVAGPIAGFLVALPVSIVGMALSYPAPKMPESQITLGMPLVFKGIHSALMALGLQKAAPIDTLLLHPLAIAGWFGMFATAMNLLPGGQLDGGHIVFSFSERAHRIVSWVTVFSLLPLAWFGWAGWLVWAIVLGISGLRHPVVYSWDKMDAKRWALLAAAVVMLVVCITPMTIGHSGIADLKEEIGGDVAEAVRQLWAWVRALGR